jgi:hypothetical protein
MTQQFLLPCECGQSIPVTAAQAGGRATCDCGRQNQVPTLGGLRKLPKANSQGDSAPAAEWNAVRGTLFVVGVVLAVVGLAVGAYGSYVRNRINLEAVHQAVVEEESFHLEEIDRLGIDELYERWKHIRDLELGRPGGSLSVYAEDLASFYFRTAVGGFVAAAVGILLAASTLIGARK